MVVLFGFKIYLLDGRAGEEIPKSSWVAINTLDLILSFDPEVGYVLVVCGIIICKNYE